MLDPKVIAAVSSVFGIVVGFLFRWALPTGRRVVDGEVSRAEADYQAALRAEEAARLTPDKNDDVAAAKRTEAARQVRLTKQRLKDLLDGIPA